MCGAAVRCVIDRNGPRRESPSGPFYCLRRLCGHFLFYTCWPPPLEGGGRPQQQPGNKKGSALHGRPSPIFHARTAVLPQQDAEPANSFPQLPDRKVSLSCRGLTSPFRPRGLHRPLPRPKLLPPPRGARGRCPGPRRPPRRRRPRPPPLQQPQPEQTARRVDGGGGGSAAWGQRKGGRKAGAPGCPHGRGHPAAGRRAEGRARGCAEDRPGHPRRCAPGVRDAEAVPAEVRGVRLWGPSGG